VPIFVDTNVLVYALDSGAGEKREQAAAWMALAWESRLGRLSVQVLQELYITLTRKLRPGLPPEAARREVRSLFPWRPIETGNTMMEYGWGLQDRFSLSWWDALIVAAARQADCRYLLTEDLRDGQDFDGTRVVNPFTNRPGSLALS
jgi:predicted nucleic acid-binding protein